MDNSVLSRYKPSKDMVLDTITGELLDYEEYEAIVKRERELITRERAEIVKGLGAKKEKEYKLNWNTHKGNATQFTKVYFTTRRELFKKLNTNERALLATLELYAEFGTNKVLWQKNNSPTNKDLMKEMGWGVDRTKYTLAALRELNIIQTTGRGLGRIIYINPIYSFNGLHLSKETYDIFFKK